MPTARKLPNGLTVHEEDFACNIAKGMSQRQAYILAGFSVTSDESADACASRLLSTAKVSERVAELREPAAREAQVTVGFIFETLLKVVAEGMKPLPIVSKGGDVVGEKPVDLPSTVSATKLLATLMDMMPAQKQAIELSGDARKAIDDMVAAVATEVEDPVLRERIIARMSGGSQPAQH